MRNISFSLTTPQFLARTKTVTRRMGWLDVKAGDRLMGCEKVMGRKSGEPLVRLGVIEVVSVSREAHSKNTQHENYFSIRDNSLVQEWHKIPGWLWLNPPFDNIAPWAEKCHKEMELGARILFLTPASIGANWFLDHCHRHSMVLGLNGRLSFDGVAPYPKDCMLSVFSNGMNGFHVWNWREGAK